MRSIYAGLIVGFAFGLIGAGVAPFLRQRYVSSKPDIVIEQSRWSDEDRRVNYLMPQKDSPAYKEWVAKYGDTADSWQMFTLGFHSKYLNELNQRITKLEKAADPNGVKNGKIETSKIETSKIE